MKKDKDKSKKGHESTIGKIIYGFLLFLPLIAIGVTCGYAIFNKNAYESFADTEKKQQNIYYSYNNLTSNEVYNLYFENNTTFDGTLTLQGEFYYYINQNGTEIDLTGYTRCYFFSNNQCYFSGDNLSQIYLAIHNTKLINFKYYGYNSTNFSGLTNMFYQIQLVPNQYIDNVFYYSIDKIQQSPLFNWTTNSLLYTGMNEFTTSLSITTPFIPLLLTYWLIISVVYFLYDIVLVILTVLHRKIHNLQDSI